MLIIQRKYFLQETLQTERMNWVVCLHVKG